MEDQLINRAIRDGYGGFPTGLHPALFLYMEVEPALVDVNVHPAKKEVRFRRAADVVNTLVEAIANTLQRHARQETRRPLRHRTNSLPPHPLRPLPPETEPRQRPPPCLPHLVLRLKFQCFPLPRNAPRVLRDHLRSFPSGPFP